MRIASLGALAGFLVFAGLLAAQNKDYTPDPSWKPPTQAATKRNPLVRDANALKQGHDLYDAECAMCHGTDGRGVANAANLHEPAVQRQSDGALFWKITTGHPEKGMPGFKHLPEDQRWQLVSYLRTFKGKNKTAANQ
jgi:mono/diheme cytochrome c family protein